MKLTDFDYHLPDELIAQTPAEPRDSARLLCLDKQSGQIDDKIFSNIADMLSDNDVLVVNETRVINARLKGHMTETDKECEIFLHKQISDNSWDCLVYPGKKLKPGTKVMFLSPDSSESGLEATITEISDK
jgi:S-adenosylmethionine:tRNA ribosyltransferase-isomerase